MKDLLVNTEAMLGNNLESWVNSLCWLENKHCLGNMSSNRLLKMTASKRTGSLKLGNKVAMLVNNGSMLGNNLLIVVQN